MSDWFEAEKNPPEQQRAEMSRLSAGCAVRDANTALAASDWDAADKLAQTAAEQDDSQRTQDDVARIRAEVAKGRAAAAVAVEPPVVADPVVVNDPPPEPVEPPTPGNGRRILGWTLVGLGGAAGVFAVSQHVAFASKNDEFETARDEAGCNASVCTGTEQAYLQAKGVQESVTADMKPLRTRAIIGYSVAGVLGVTGAALVLISGSGAEVAWIPPAGATVSVRF